MSSYATYSSLRVGQREDEQFSRKTVNERRVTRPKEVATSEKPAVNASGIRIEQESGKVHVFTAGRVRDAAHPLAKDLEVLDGWLSYIAGTDLIGD